MVFVDSRASLNCINWVRATPPTTRCFGAYFNVGVGALTPYALPSTLIADVLWYLER